jgi:hydrogenase maturation protein HypF
MTDIARNPTDTVRLRCLFSGIVQGVGFRPFIWRIATRNDLSGFVKNTSDGVTVEVEGSSASVDRFLVAAREELPPLADIADLVTEVVPCAGEDEFTIITSERTGPSAIHITPDIATCDACLGELLNAADRRYHYPFINCTNCGPRLTIIGDIPYDRKNTSMSAFPLCPECRHEYENPADRRFHAEPNACPACGPRLTLLGGRGESIVTPDPVAETVGLLRAGMTVAIRGLGGFHLAVEATNDEAIRRLRTNKCREEKPFALMVKDIRAAREIVDISPEEELLLVSPQRPIVLLKRRAGGAISPCVAPGMGTFGVMLPYTPLHHLLFDADSMGPLVMTSGNRSGEPIAIGIEDALVSLSGIADYFLVHNREILVRCDDSIAMVAGKKGSILRRSRGYAPKPIALCDTYPEVLAVGGHLKTTLCLLKGRSAFMSPYVGDMDTPAAREFFFDAASLMKRITECEPSIIACDLHPGYFTAAAARKLQGTRPVAVQHHHAHVVSCMAENGITGRVIGVALDGTGYGTDGTIWGGEFLTADEISFERAGHLSPFRLPGGEAAVHEPWRSAADLLRGAFGEEWWEIAERLGVMPDHALRGPFRTVVEKGLNSPVTTSLGRFFDGIAAILGIRGTVSFEGQAAMELETRAGGTTGRVLPFAIEEEDAAVVLNLFPAVREITRERISGKTPETLAAAFHATAVRGIVRTTAAIRERTGIVRVVLSGGCFQNRILLEGVIDELTGAGFDVFSHHHVPTNDGGIALGQAVSAGARSKAGMEG